MSPVWQKLKQLRPGLPRHLDIQTRDFRGERWYLLHDKSTGRYHRMSPSAYRVLGLMNGHRTLADILALSTRTADDSGAEPATEQELIELLQYLHVADLLVCDLPPSTRDLFERQQQKRRRGWYQLLINPLTWRIPLGNPNRILQPLMPLARLLATPAVGVLWLLVVGYALLQAGAHWSELTTGQLANLLAPANMLLLWLTYPLLKIAHELGHSLFTKVWGGEVNECGVVFIVGTPLPYVDATAATGFRTKARRLMVGAAGMAVELFIAAIALLMWLNIEDGLARSVLFNIVVLGSVSTLMFNGNPLLKFDGYHLLCDLAETPNLGARANQHIAYLIQRYGYGIEGLSSSAASRGEAIGFTLYAICAFCFRLFVLSVIVYLVANLSLTIGIALGLWFIAFQLLLPLAKQSLFLLQSPALQRRRKRALGLTLTVLVTVTVLVFYVPVPLSTKAEGVLWLPAESRVRAQTQGEVAQVRATDGQIVDAGQPLIQLDNPALVAELELQTARLKEYQARYQQAWADDRPQVNLLMEDIQATLAEVTHLQQRVNNLEIRSPFEGRISFTQSHDLQGSYLKQGDIVGFVVRRSAPRIRVALTQRQVGLVSTATQSVEVKMASRPGLSVSAQVSQQVPEATFNLPSPVLGVAGGGRLPLADDDTEGSRTQQMVFLLDVTLPDIEGELRYGERAHVLFRHPPEPVAAQIYRRARQLFISTLRH